MNEVVEELRLLLEQDFLPESQLPLIGDERVLDSLGLVELCLRLEDRALAAGFVFDWTSESAMSISRSMFRSVQDLQDEFDRQRAAQA